MATDPRGTKEVPDTLKAVFMFGPLNGLKKFELDDPAHTALSIVVPLLELAASWHCPKSRSPLDTGSWW